MRLSRRQFSTFRKQQNLIIMNRWLFSNRRGGAGDSSDEESTEGNFFREKRFQMKSSFLKSLATFFFEEFVSRDGTEGMIIIIITCNTYTIYYGFKESTRDASDQLKYKRDQCILKNYRKRSR